MARPPSTGAVTSKFGIRPKPTPTSPAFHYGEDTIGRGNVAPVSGTVVFAGTSGQYGKVVGIRTSRATVWWVAHHASLAVDVGDKVHEGQRIGQLGATGNVTGPHAHTERRVGGTNRPGTGIATNPRRYYGKGSTKPTTAPVIDLGDDDMPIILKTRSKANGGDGDPIVARVSELEGVVYTGTPADQVSASANDQAYGTVLVKDKAAIVTLVNEANTRRRVLVEELAAKLRP